MIMKNNRQIKSREELERELEKINKLLEIIPEKMNKYEHVVFVGLTAAQTSLEWVLGKREMIDLLLQEDHPVFAHQRDFK